MTIRPTKNRICQPFELIGHQAKSGGEWLLLTGGCYEFAKTKEGP
jgi:hypothetical protein